jgi:hypothetical protein
MLPITSKVLDRVNSNDFNMKLNVAYNIESTCTFNLIHVLRKYYLREQSNM